MSGSSLLRLIAKKVVFTASASTDAEHIRLAIISLESTTQGPPKSHLLLFLAASRARTVEFQQFGDKISILESTAAYQPYPPVSDLPERISSIFDSHRKVVYQPTLPRPYLCTVFYLNCHY
jgi:hypothetical protein